MDSETRDFINDGFAKVYERLDAHGAMLDRHDERDSALRSNVSDLTSKVDRITTYAATIHDDVKLLLRAHPEL